MNFKSATLNARTAASNSGLSLGKGCMIFFVVLAIFWFGSGAIGASLWSWAFGPSEEIAQPVEQQAESLESLIRVSTGYGEFPFIVEKIGEASLLTGDDGVQMLCEDIDDLGTCVSFANAQGATLSDNEFAMPDKLDLCLDGNGGATCTTTGKPRAAKSYK